MRKFPTNPFLGINPLLNSQLQEAGEWVNFHTAHIVDLMRHLQRDLLPLGYVAQVERSLQIRLPEGSVRFPTADVSIYDPQRRSADIGSATSGLRVPVPELLQLDDPDASTYRAAAIYEQAPDTARGDAVAWLELLSPTNKPGGGGFAAYREKRNLLLQTGLVFIEVDYLHQQRPTVAVPVYPDQPNSSAYRIVVIDPRPDWRAGEGRVYPVHVDERLPTVEIPLNAGDVFAFDFDAPYQATFTASFFGNVVDYDTLPAEFARYSDTDRARILTRLLALDPDTPPAPLEPLPLDEALRRWEAR